MDFLQGIIQSLQDIILEIIRDYTKTAILTVFAVIWSFRHGIWKLIKKVFAFITAPWRIKQVELELANALKKAEEAEQKYLAEAKKAEALSSELEKKSAALTEAEQKYLAEADKKNGVDGTKV